jgi:hypothetical protein
MKAADHIILEAARAKKEAQIYRLLQDLKKGTTLKKSMQQKSSLAKMRQRVNRVNEVTAFYRLAKKDLPYISIGVSGF